MSESVPKTVAQSWSCGSQKAAKKVVPSEKNSYAGDHIKIEISKNNIIMNSLEAHNVKIFIPAIHGSLDWKTNDMKHKFFSQNKLRKGWQFSNKNH